MRMTYGHGGTRMGRVIVTSLLPESSPMPLWLRLLLVAIWIAVLALVSLFGTPKSSVRMNTIIDISQLTVKPPPAFEKLIRPKPEQVLPINPPPLLPEAVPEQVIRKPLERSAVLPPPEEVTRTSIARSSNANLPDLTESRANVTRERRAVETESSAAAAIRLRRESTPGEMLTEKTAISRSRGATVVDAPAVKDRAAVLRRAPSGSLPDTGVGTPQRPVMRSERSVSQMEEKGPRAVASRERTKFAGGNEGEPSSPAPSSVGLARGVALQNLEICSSPLLEEEDIKAILRVVGSRQSCSDQKGEFQFKGTKRISSFNLVVFPSPGRKPSNRCEELENAFKCLKAH